MKGCQVSGKSADKYGVVRELLADGFGLKLGEDSPKLKGAVRERMRVLGLKGLTRYRACLKGVGGGEELFGLAGEVVAGQSDFGDPHLMALCEQFLRPILRGRLNNRPEGSQASLSLWSVGCGNGAELYSVLMQMATLTQLAGWQVRGLGTDLGSGPIELARRGLYTEKELGALSQEDLRNFFSMSVGESGQGERWTIAKTLSGVCRFEQHNILAPEVPGDSSEGFNNSNFNLIFCRGVLEHLSQTNREEVLGKLARALSPNGLLVVGEGQARLFDHSLLDAEADEFESTFRRRTGRLTPIESASVAGRGRNEMMGLRRRLRSVFSSGSAGGVVVRRRRAEEGLNQIRVGEK